MRYKRILCSILYTHGGGSIPALVSRTTLMGRRFACRMALLRKVELSLYTVRSKAVLFPLSAH